MIKPRYILITSIFTFFMLSLIYGFNYINPINYEDELERLETRYANDYDETQSYIETQLKKDLSTSELATYMF